MNVQSKTSNLPKHAEQNPPQLHDTMYNIVAILFAFHRGIFHQILDFTAQGSGKCYNTPH